MHKLFFTIAAALIISPAPTFAQTAPAQPQAAKPAKDPKEVV